MIKRLTISVIKMIILNSECLSVKSNLVRKAGGGASVKGDVVSVLFNVSVKCEHLCYKPSLLALY